MKEYIVKIKSHYFNNGKKIDIDTTKKGKIIKLSENKEINASNLINAAFLGSVDEDDEITPFLCDWVLDKTTDILNNLKYFSYEEAKE